MNSRPKPFTSGARLVALILIASASWAHAATHHVDPARGSPTGDGSSTSPWKTLQGVAQRGLLARVQGDDQVLLYSGDHGAVVLSGHNAKLVTVSAAPGHTPRLSRLVVREGSRWRFRGLTVSPSFGAAPYAGSIVSLGDGGRSAELELEGCFVYSVLDSSAWTARDWLTANDGVWLGRHGSRLVVRNCHVLNTRFAIQLAAPSSLCEGNLVSNFSGDGVRVMRDDLTVQWNVIKNAYCGPLDGDANHDDGIQCFPFTGTSSVHRATISGNLIVAREDDQQRFPGDMQGIGFFDGPLVDFLVEDNVVLVEHWHGVSLYDAQRTRILRNLVHSRWAGPRQPWVKLGSKQGLTRGNTVQGNYAQSFDLAADPQVRASENRVVTPAIYRARRRELEAQITRRFGARHPLSGGVR